MSRDDDRFLLLGPDIMYDKDEGPGSPTVKGDFGDRVFRLDIRRSRCSRFGEWLSTTWFLSLLTPLYLVDGAVNGRDGHLTMCKALILIDFA